MHLNWKKWLERFDAETAVEETELNKPGPFLSEDVALLSPLVWAEFELNGEKVAGLVTRDRAIRLLSDIAVAAQLPAKPTDGRV